MTVAEIKRNLNVAVEDFRREQAAGNSEEAEKALERVRKLNKELSDARTLEEAERNAAGKNLDDQQIKELQKFSFAKFMREVCNEDGKHNLTGFEREMHEEAKKVNPNLKGAGIPYEVLYARASTGQNAGTAADGGNLIQEAPLTYLEMLRKRLVLTQLGAKFMTGLVGHVPVVSSTDPVFEWLAESASSTTQKTGFSKRVLQPKRTALTMAYSKDLLIQSSTDVERLIMEKMVNAHAQGLENAAINGTGTNNQPTGILNTTGIGSVVMGTNGGAIDWKSVVALETAITAKDADLNALAYLTNAKVVGDLKTKEKSAGTARFLMELRDELNGMRIAKTNIVPSKITKGTATECCSAMICGDFSDLWIGQWGGLDVVIDPYTLKKEAEIEVTMNAWHDVLLGHVESFAAIKDLTTG